ncbi:MAG TPA: GH116 family glycosyl-hydrolase, partial [Nitrospiria bacterium]
MTRDGARQGCPIGGMGAGSIGRSYYGDFARWQIIPYEHIYDNEVYGSQFHLFVKPKHSNNPFVQTLMAGSPAEALRPSRKNTLSKWPWNYPARRGAYSALFPKAWCDYSDHPENPVGVILEQFAPVIPHDYLSSSLPLGIYTWHLENPLKETVEIGLLFTFENLVGRLPEGRNATRNIGEYSQCRWAEEMADIRQVHRVISGESSLGVSLSCHPEDLRKLPLSRRGELGISVGEGDSGAELSCLAAFDCRGDGGEVADSFFRHGKLPDGPAEFSAEAGKMHGAAVCATVTLQPGEKSEIPMVLAWDFPEIQISAPEGRIFKRKYTEYKKDQKINALKLAEKGIEKRVEWSNKIDQWHDEVRDSLDRNPLMVRTVLNEQYYLLDGGTLWEAGTNNFGMLESVDYFNYETLDVRFYYSFTTLRYWPMIENRVMELFAEGIGREDKKIVPWKYGYDYGYQRPE